MRPFAIVKQAKTRGLHVIAVCDHNSTRNVHAVRRAGQRQGLAVIGGMEVTSEEEVHILGLFDEEGSLRQMQRLVDENLTGENNPELFGRQWLCDENDEVVGQEARLLIGATALTVEEIVGSIHELGGVAVPSHVDRPSFALLSQLGFVPEQLEIDAVEVSQRYSVAEARDRFPQIRNYPAIRCSDAHRLEEIGSASTAFTGLSPSANEFRRALLGEDEREVIV